MKRLHLLGFTHDLKGVVFAQRKGAKTATVWVPIDEAFNDAVRKLERARADKADAPKGGSKRKKEEPPPAPPEEQDDRPLPPVGRSPVASGMRPSEIQQLLREGRSVNSVAEASKAPRAWVERLAEPVLAERHGVVQMAQNAIMPRPRLGPSGLALGEAVRRNLEGRRAPLETIERLDDAWDARLARSGGWRVFVRFNHRGKRRTAEWEFHKGRRQILPRNRLAGQLGWWPPEAADEPEPNDAEDEAMETGEHVAIQIPPPLRRPAKRRRPAAKAKRPVRKAPRPTRKRPAARRKKPVKRPARRRR
jgi:hypothetical protein